jgi:hypothetical protein
MTILEYGRGRSGVLLVVAEHPVGALGSPSISAAGITHRNPPRAASLRPRRFGPASVRHHSHMSTVIMPSVPRAALSHSSVVGMVFEAQNA